MKLWLQILLLAPLPALAFDSNELLIAPELVSRATLEAKSSVAEAGLQYDIETLILSLKNGYGGYRVLAPQLETEVFPALRALRLPDASTDQICTAVGQILDRIPDNHIAVNYLNSQKDCGKSPRRKGRVGRNIKSEGHGPWGYYEIKDGGRRIPALAITYMELLGNSGWDGVIEKVREIYRFAPALIIDLRGNGGGDSRMPLEIARILYGLDGQDTDLKNPYRIVQRQTPEAMALFANTFAVKSIWSRLSGAPERPEVKALYQKYSTDFQLALKGQLRPEDSYRQSALQLSTLKMFKRPIRILVDAECASACEIMMEFFERHLFAKTVGENTAGYVHFGNVGLLWLKNSNIVVSLPTQASTFEDGRFVEKIGYAPAIPVPPGQDALDYALEDIRRNLGGL